MISLHEAQAQVLAAAGILLEPESVPLADCGGRRLATDFHADGPWPQTDRSAMDGFGVRAGEDGLAAGTVLAVVGECLAGHPFDGEVSDGQAIRIMTGAVVPDSVDAVVMVEHTSGYEGAEVTVREPVQRGQNIRPVGSEVAMGQLLLHAGSRIGAAEVGALAVLGIDPVPVFRRPRVAILATGDEVVPVQNVPQPHQVRNSNALALAAQVRERGGEPIDLGVARDEEADLRQRLQRGLAEADVLLTIGGVSKGTHDLVHRLFEELGVRQVFHGIALKPGKPTFFGQRGFDDAAGSDASASTYVFGLPGNPASCFTVFDLLVAPLLAHINGAPARTGGPTRAWRDGEPFKKNWRLQAVPCELRLDDQGRMQAYLGSSKPSGDPFSLLGADAYALLPPETQPDDLELVDLCWFRTNPGDR